MPPFGPISRRNLVRARRLAAGICLCVLLGGCRDAVPPEDPPASDDRPQRAATSTAPAVSGTASQIVAAARWQIGKTVTYDPTYVVLTYPGGDVPIDKGVCTDVVIRALRQAWGMDMQKLVREDMSRAFSEYPRNWGLSRPDANIDHRRVPNLMRYFERAGYSLPVTSKKEDYQGGDLVTCTVGVKLPHIMIVSDKLTPDDVPMVIHNIGGGTQEEDRLFTFPITGHYRLSTPPAVSRRD